MALEDLTGPNKGIGDYVAANPDGLDPRSEGDNHIRGVKNTLLNTFGAMQSKNVSTPATGAALQYDGAKYVPVQMVPIGTILDWAGAGSVPAGYLACDGAAVSRTTYALLFAVLSTTWGAGDGSTTFNTPGLNRRTTVGSGGTGTGTLGNAVGNTGGAETHALSTAELASHVHFVLGDGGGGGGSGLQGTTDGGPSGGKNSNSAGSGTAHNNMQPSAVVRKIIRTGLPT